MGGHRLKVARRHPVARCGLQVTILTGRPHQIRIHMAALGHPLVDDPLYGPGGVPKVGEASASGLEGTGLPASHLCLKLQVLFGRKLAGSVCSAGWLSMARHRQNRVCCASHHAIAHMLLHVCRVG